MHNNLVIKLLGIENSSLEIVNQHQKASVRYIEVMQKIETHACLSCDFSTTRVHDNRTRNITHSTYT